MYNNIRKHMTREINMVRKTHVAWITDEIYTQLSCSTRCLQQYQ